jgi:hypothetical protein
VARRCVCVCVCVWTRLLGRYQEATRKVPCSCQHAHTQTHRQTDRQTGRQADRQTGRQAGRQAASQLAGWPYLCHLFLERRQRLLFLYDAMQLPCGYHAVVNGVCVDQAATRWLPRSH